jgi:hypothetical protein
MGVWRPPGNSTTFIIRDFRRRRWRRKRSFVCYVRYWRDHTVGQYFIVPFGTPVSARHRVAMVRALTPTLAADSQSKTTRQIGCNSCARSDLGRR